MIKGGFASEFWVKVEYSSNIFFFLVLPVGKHWTVMVVSVYLWLIWGIIVDPNVIAKYLFLLAELTDYISMSPPDRLVYILTWKKGILLEFSLELSFIFC